MRYDGTATVIMQAVRDTGITDPDALAPETGIPAYIIRRYADAIQRGVKARRKAQAEETQPDATTTTR